MKERRSIFVAEEQKFSTQKFISYSVVLLFTAVTAWILSYGTSEQKSIIIQTIIGLMIGVVAFWIGSSKGSADKEAQLTKLIQPPSVQSAAVIANTAATEINTEALDKSSENK